METIQEIKTKLISDRLWVLLLYVVLVFANQWLALGVPDEQLTEVLWAVLAFILGKSLRGTGVGNILAGLIPGGLKAVQKIEPAPFAEKIPQNLREGAGDAAVSGLETATDGKHSDR